VVSGNNLWKVRVSIYENAFCYCRKPNSGNLRNQEEMYKKIFVNKIKMNVIFGEGHITQLMEIEEDGRRAGPIS
jgi:hypothetical protein